MFDIYSLKGSLVEILALQDTFKRKYYMLIPGKTKFTVSFYSRLTDYVILS